MIIRTVDYFTTELRDETITVYVLEDKDKDGEFQYIVTDQGDTIFIARECVIDDESMDGFITSISHLGVMIDEESGALSYTTDNKKEAIRVASILADYIRTEL